jgi:uncharacterized protein YjdB
MAWEKKVTSLTLDKTALSLTVGKGENLTVTVAPENATNKNVAWASGDPAIAIVDTTGKVTAVGVGAVKITATTEDGGFVAECEVTVTVPNEDKPPVVTPPEIKSETPVTETGMVKVKQGGIIRVIPKHKVDEYKAKGFVEVKE